MCPTRMGQGPGSRLRLGRGGKKVGQVLMEPATTETPRLLLPRASKPIIDRIAQTRGLAGWRVSPPQGSSRSALPDPDGSRPRLSASPRPGRQKGGTGADGAGDNGNTPSLASPGEQADHRSDCADPGPCRVACEPTSEIESFRAARPGRVKAPALGFASAGEAKKVGQVLMEPATMATPRLLLPRASKPIIDRIAQTRGLAGWRVSPPQRSNRSALPDPDGSRPRLSAPPRPGRQKGGTGADGAGDNGNTPSLASPGEQADHRSDCADPGPWRVG